VIVTGSLGILGVTLGDYLTKIIPLGNYSSTIWACLAVIVFSFLNALGIREGKAQNGLTLIEIIGVCILILVGFYVGLTSTETSTHLDSIAHHDYSLGSYSMALVFVLLTFGGWNEAAYVSAEAIDQKRGIRQSLILGLGIVTILYILVNIAMIYALGVENMGKSMTVASDVFEIAFGKNASVYFSLLVIFLA
jgi:amino acid transporter